ncbi:MAG: competence/damage-inducible protein A [Phycisphaerales bacterium]|nr:competence/damage-inducible protein A [Phycisphaerales bacterium]
MQTACILSIGTELTLGQTVDTNGAWLAAELAALGVRTVLHMTVADELEPLGQALRTVAERAEVVVATGGLGPTDDDLTRAAMARVLGAELVSDPDSLDQIRAFFAARGRLMPAQNAVQALIPEGARALPNTCGTAPGLAAVVGRTAVYCLPGVPFEMRAMFRREVAPAIQRAAAGAVILSSTLRTTGLPESEVGARLQDLMVRGRNPEVGTTAALGIIGVRINATGRTIAEAEALRDAVEAEVRVRLGDAVFGRNEETLADAVGELLRVRRATVSVAESCTGGLIGALLTDVPGSSAYFRGGVIAYANHVKVDVLGVPEGLLAAEGAVSATVAEALARGAARVLQSDYAVSVTGVAGPGGGSVEKPVGLVYTGLHTPEATVAERHQFGSDAPRDAIRQRAAWVALDRLRRALRPGLGQPAATGG